VALGALANGGHGGLHELPPRVRAAENRTVYVDSRNTLNGVVLAMPFIGGWILTGISFAGLFAITAVVSSLGLLGSLRVRELERPAGRTPGVTCPARRSGHNGGPGGTMDGTRQRVLQGRLYRLLGDLPARERPVGVLSRIVEERERYVLERLSLDLNGIEPVPAYLVRPLKAAGKLPVGGLQSLPRRQVRARQGRAPAGNTYMERPPYADEITRLGYAGLAIDAWNFGERSGRLELDLFKELLWHGMVLWGSWSTTASRPWTTSARAMT